MFVVISGVTTKIKIKRIFDKQANRGGKLNTKKESRRRKERREKETEHVEK